MNVSKTFVLVAISIFVAFAPLEASPAGIDAGPLPPEVESGHLELPSAPPAEAPEIEGGVDEAPAGKFVRGNFVSVQVNVNSNGSDVLNDAANEPSIAVDPTDPTRMAIGWRQFDTISNSFRQSGIAYSDDAGKNWTSPGATKSHLGVLEPGVFSSDPVLEFNADGKFYYYALQPGRGPGAWACYLYGSDDGGVTWPLETYAWGGDKPWMTVDRTGGIGHGNLYIAWSPFAGCCGGDLFTRSTDAGLSFLAPISIPESPRWGTLTVDPHGNLFIVGSGSGGFTVVRSSDAQDASMVPVFDQVSTVDLGGILSFGDGPNPSGLLGQAWIASDHSSGSSRGNLYVLSSVDPPGNDPLDVMFSRSTDGGQNWSAPMRVNDDGPLSNSWQWFGTMSVAPNGRIDVIWNDTRNLGLENWSELYYSFSLDEGKTWSPNQAASPLFNSYLGWPQQNKLGDYYDMISDNAGAHLAYAATFNGGQDVYYLRLHVDGCFAGDAECDDGVKCTSDVCNLATNTCSNDPIVGCCSNDSDCDDSDGCTMDVCDLTTNTCSNVIIPNCCRNDGECDDGDECSIDTCSNNACEYSEASGCGEIPSLSEWGVIVMSLMLLIAARIHFGSRRAFEGVRG